MSGSEQQQVAQSVADEQSLRVAVAISLLRSKLLQNQPLPPPPPSVDQSDALRWKRKAKERKLELLRLRQDLNEAEVRFKERRRRRTSGSSQRRHFSDTNSEDEMEQLRASIDFLVELCESDSPVDDANFMNRSHQAVDFILGSEHSESEAQFFVQHLIRKLGSEPYVGQRALFSVSQRISVLAENFLFKDPFDDAFTNMHQCMFILIQLTEFLVSDYLSEWSKDEGFNTMLFEEWVASVLQARKALEVLESRNGLYVMYMDRVAGELARLVGQNMSLQKLNREVLDNLFH
ncbi:hypothetical protein DVH24_028957 [Malus domestica]|uniref:Multipolar spindle 1 n=1 Tax=Malus domestica TaxID=3750 RepID=A0A498HS17_MALDO|nr:hypothetical protein DVH24_028957 [Malus domestica]